MFVSNAETKLVTCEILKWVSDEPIPGLVEARMPDAQGRQWVFVDKVGVFTRRPLRRDTSFPTAGGMRCVVINAHEAGRAAVAIRLIDTDANGVRDFVVTRSTLFDEGQDAP